MNRKLLTLLAAAGFALFFGACGDENSSSAPKFECEEGTGCLDDEELSSSSQHDSSSSVEEDKKNSSSSATKNDSSDSKSESSSSEKPEQSSSSVESSSSEEPISSSSVEESSSSAKPVEYVNTTPNLADLEVSGDTLFALFQRQNADFTITHNGLLALFNLGDGTLLDTIQLATKNPSAVKIANGNIYVSTSGSYDDYYSLPADDNRGIEKIDLQNKTSSLFVAGTKLGGGVNDFVVDKKNNKGYAQVYKSYGDVKIFEIDLTSGSAAEFSDKFTDPTGSLEFDESNSTLYIGNRYMDWGTFEMDITVYAYNGTTLTTITDPEEEMRMPYSIKSINGVPYVFVSDYNSGALYLNYADVDDEGLPFFQDSKLAVVNDELFVMERNGANATIAKIDPANGTILWQNTASGKNPYDMVAAGSNTAWVAYYDSPIIELLNTNTKASIKLIDTKAFCATKVE